MKFLFRFFLLIVLANSQVFSQETELFKVLNNLKVELVQPGTISTKGFEFGATISPDGNEFFFVKGLPRFSRTVLVYSNWENDLWTVPKVAPFSGTYNDTNPYFSKDGRKFYFTSDRPSGNPSVKGKNYWYVERIPNGWTDPKLVSGKINDEYDIVYPTIQMDGTIHFVSWNRPDSKNGDIYISKFEDGVYSMPELVEELNTEYSDADPEPSTDGQFMFLTSTREGGLGYYDLYVFKKQKDGKWGNAINLGNKVNSNRMDSDPILSPDGRTLYFSSDRLSPEQSYSDYKTISSFYDKIHNGNMNIYKVDIGELLSVLRKSDF